MQGIFQFLKPGGLPDIIGLSKDIEKLQKNPQRGNFNFNATLVRDLVQACDDIRIIVKDFGFYSINNICPNMTDLLVQVAGMGKATMALIMDAGVAAAGVIQMKENCDKQNSIPKTTCYANMVVPALKTANILTFNVKDMITAARKLLQGVLADWDYCKGFKKLPSAERKKVLEAWKNANSETCKKRVQQIMNTKVTNMVIKV